MYILKDSLHFLFSTFSRNPSLSEKLNLFLNDFPVKMGIQKNVQTSKIKEIYFFFTHDTSAPFSSSPKTFFCEISYCAEKSSKSMLAVRWDENRLRSFCLQTSHSEVLNSVCAYFRSLGKWRIRKFDYVWSREVKNVQFRVTLNFSEIKSLREWSSWSLILLRKTLRKKTDLHDH